MTLVETRVQDYERWLHVVANRMLGWTDHPMHDDLVQEGRIAIWRAEGTHDPDLGAAPAWLTRAAEMRMGNLAYGHGQPFGREATRGKREVATPVNLEALEPSHAEELAPAQADIADIAMMAYHSGNMLRAIEALTPARRDAVRKFLADGIMDSNERYHWKMARTALAEELASLEGIA